MFTLKAATRSDVLYFFGQGNLTFIREFRESQGILKSNACGINVFVPSVDR